MSATTYLIMANALVWAGIAGYLGFLATRASELKKREQQIELLGGGNDS